MIVTKIDFALIVKELTKQKFGNSVLIFILRACLHRTQILVQGL